MEYYRCGKVAIMSTPRWSLREAVVFFSFLEGMVHRVHLGKGMSFPHVDHPRHRPSKFVIEGGYLYVLFRGLFIGSAIALTVVGCKDG